MVSIFHHRIIILFKFKPLLALLILLGLSGCSSIGPTGVLPESSNIDLGPAVELRVCIYRDVNVSEKRAASIIAALQKEFAQYGLIIRVPSIREWERPSFRHKGILRDIALRPLEPPFDRNLALVSRNFGDFLWGSLMPEILGAVETWTHTKGYVVAEMGSLNQLLTFNGPHRAAIHEFYHMLGIDHMEGKEGINQKIAELKRLAIENRESGIDFFPGISSDGKVYMSRNAVDHRFGLVQKTTVAKLEQGKTESTE